MIHIQLQQFLTLLTLLVIAKETAYLYLSWLEIAGILIFTFVVEHLLIYSKYKEVKHISYSALTTALGVMLMMFAVHYWIYLLAIAVALLQKHFLRWHNRHLFNPSNFALIFALVFFFQDANIVLGQLGDDFWLQGVLLVLALAILVRVKRWFIPLSFTLFYILFQYLIVAPSDPMFLMEDIYDRFYTVSFVLFVAFMLTDPRTTPHAYTGQGVYSLGIALGAAYMDAYYGFRVQHLFLILFLATALNVLIETYQSESLSPLYSIKLVSMVMMIVGIIFYVQAQVPYYLEMQ